MVLTLRELAQIVPFVKSARQKKNFLLLCALSYVDRPLYPDVRYNLSAVSDANALLEYRFDVAGIRRLAYLLGLPAVVITKRRYRVTRDEAMCVLLGRLAFPVRFHRMTKTFGRSRAALCEIFAHVVGEIYDRWKSLMYFNDRLVRENMDTYCQAVHAYGAPLSNVYGFIDGTKLQTCRISPTCEGNNLQRQVYSGHKRVHCLNYQAIAAPDGICIHFFGPVKGRRHDTTMLRLSRLSEHLARHPALFAKRFIYGDPAYGVGEHILSGFKGVNVSTQKKEFNKWMSRVRQAVEWNFMIMKSLWAFITYKNLAKIRLSPVAKIVCVAMFLTNCHCCHFRGNQISDYFGLEPPHLEQYLDTHAVVDL